MERLRISVQSERARGGTALLDALAELARLRETVEALADQWRYKGEFGWGPWQIGEGPDQEGYVLDQAATQLRAALAGAGQGETNDPNDQPEETSHG